MGFAGEVVFPALHVYMGQLYFMLHEYLPAAQASGMWREELGERLKGLLRPILLHKCHLQART